MSMSGVHIDDRDLSKVNYTGNWNVGGSTTEYNGTVSSSNNVGDYFTVSFEGTAITAFGTFDATSGGVVTNYSIDGGPVTQVISQYGLGDIPHQQFWVSGQLPYSKHKLVVTMARVNFNPSPTEGTIWFDYFIVKSSNATSPLGSEQNPLQNAGSQKHPTGAIIGGVIGGSLFVMICVGALLFIFYRRYKRKLLDQPTEQLYNVQSTRAGAVKPFLVNDRSLLTPMTIPNRDSHPNSVVSVRFHKSSDYEQTARAASTPPGPFSEPPGAETSSRVHSHEDSAPSERRNSSVRQDTDNSAQGLNSQVSTAHRVPHDHESPPVYSLD